MLKKDAVALALAQRALMLKTYHLVQAGCYERLAKGTALARLSGAERCPVCQESFAYIRKDLDVLKRKMAIRKTRG